MKTKDEWASKKDLDTKSNVFKLLNKGLTNLQIVDRLDITYTEVLSYRFAYEAQMINKGDK